MITNQNNMEIDLTGGVPTWVATCLDESQAFTIELALEGPISFQYEYVRIQHMKYHKGTKRLQIDQFKVKGKQVTVSWGS